MNFRYIIIDTYVINKDINPYILYCRNDERTAKATCCMCHTILDLGFFLLSEIQQTAAALYL